MEQTAAPPSAPINRIRWWIHLLIIAAYPIAVGILSWQRAPANGPALSSSSRGLLIVAVVHLLIFGVVFGLAYLASRPTREDLLLRWRLGFWAWPLGFSYSIALRLAVAVLV